MTTLITGFDSAWTFNNSGAIVGVLRDDNGAYRVLDAPTVVNFEQATRSVLGWQNEWRPTSTVQLIDQPIIVTNATGQRPVESIVSSIVGACGGGMQPASRSRLGMFDDDAPVWRYLNAFGGTVNPSERTASTVLIETYPALALMALERTPETVSGAYRLPKYNPARKKTFVRDDWIRACSVARNELVGFRLAQIEQWVAAAQEFERPQKPDQDCLDACICLITALHLIEGEICLMIGDTETGYIVVPFNRVLDERLRQRCEKIKRDPSDSVRELSWS